MPCDFRLGLGLLPFAFAFTLIFNMLVTYIWAVNRDDVDPLFPYISSTADKRPESCLFGILANICSLLNFSIIFVRYRTTSSLHTNDTFVFPARLNYYSLFVGSLGAFGMFLIANVQETAATGVHMALAVITFGAGTLYMIMQTYVTRKMTPVICNYSMLTFRIFFTASAVVLFVLAITFGTIAAHIFHSVYPDLPTPRPWSRKIYQPGFEYHMVSAGCEWALAVMQVLFIVSFSPELERVEYELNIVHKDLESERVKLIEHRVVDPYGW